MPCRLDVSNDSDDGNLVSSIRSVLLTLDDDSSPYAEDDIGELVLSSIRKRRQERKQKEVPFRVVSTQKCLMAEEEAKEACLSRFLQELPTVSSCDFDHDDGSIDEQPVPDAFHKDDDDSSYYSSSSSDLSSSVFEQTDAMQQAINLAKVLNLNLFHYDEDEDEDEDKEFHIGYSSPYTPSGREEVSVWEQ